MKRLFGETRGREERRSSLPPTIVHVSTTGPSGDTLGKKESFAPTKEEGQDKLPPANPRHKPSFKERLRAV